MRHVLETVGWVNPIVCDSDRVVLAGHLRLEVALALGVSEVPVIRVGDMTPAQRRAYIIADNKLAEGAGWNREVLALEFQSILEIDSGFDLSLTGFETGEIDMIIRNAAQAAADDVADEAIDSDSLPTNAPIAEPGDLWRLGDHHLMCGDSTDAGVMARLMMGRRADVVFSDPPYNVPIAGHVSGSGRHREFAMAAGEMSDGEFAAFLLASFRLMAANSTDGAVSFVCMDWRHLLHLLLAGRRARLDFLNLCVWAKTNAGLGSFYRSQHELVAVFRNGSAAHVNNVELGRFGRNRTNVWTYPGMNSFGSERDEALASHPTVKPVALVEDAILDCSNRGGLVLDPFAGAGTTLIAAQRSGRRAVGVEIDPHYVDVALRRFRKATGIEPIHVGTGAKFSELEQARRLPTTGKDSQP